MLCRAGLGSHLADAQQAAAGGVEDLAVDPARVIGSQEGDDVADVVGPADPAPDALGGGPGLGRRVDEPGIHLGVGEPRRDRVDADVALARAPARSRGRPCWMMNSTALTLTANSRSKSSSATSSTRP